MGFFGKMFEAVTDVFSSVLDLGREVVREVTERVGRVIDAAEKGDWGEVFREVAETMEAVVGMVKEISEKAVTVMEQVTGVLFEGVEQVVSVVKEVGNFLFDHFKEHPEECLGILTSFIGAAAAFASGNVPGAMALLASGFVKAYRLRDVVREERPDLDVEREYPLPPQVTKLAEETREVPNEELDRHFAEQAKKINLAEA